MWSAVRGGVVLIAISGMVTYVYFRRTPNGVALSGLAKYRARSPADYDAAVEAVQAFHAERARSQPDINVMSTQASLFTKHARQIQMQLPNEASADADIERIIVSSERAMQDHMQRVRRGSSSLLFPKPIGSYFSDM